MALEASQRTFPQTMLMGLRGLYRHPPRVKKVFPRYVISLYTHSFPGNRLRLQADQGRGFSPGDDDRRLHGFRDRDELQEAGRLDGVLRRYEVCHDHGLAVRSRNVRTGDL